jgi:hypothetical protein
MQIKSYIHLIAAILIYGILACYFYPQQLNFAHKLQLLLPFNSIVAAFGCYILSRRWISGFVESVLAGALFGFGPYFFGMARFHPAAALPAALMPWCFLPAAYAAKFNKKWLSIPAGLLPFLTMIVFFSLTAKLRLFVAPLKITFSKYDLVGFFVPLLAAYKGFNLSGIYHVPLAGLIFGLFMLVKARRLCILLIIAVALTLAFYQPINTYLQVCPLLWLSIPMLCGSIISGVGLQGIIFSSTTDRKWILYSVIITCSAAIASLLLATKLFQIFLSLGDRYAILVCKDAMYYIIGSAAVSIIYLINVTGVRLHWVRLVIITGAVGLDFLFTAGYIIGTIL